MLASTLALCAAAAAHGGGTRGWRTRAPQHSAHGKLRKSLTLQLQRSSSAPLLLDDSSDTRGCAAPHGGRSVRASPHARILHTARLRAAAADAGRHERHSLCASTADASRSLRHGATGRRRTRRRARESSGQSRSPVLRARTRASRRLCVRSVLPQVRAGSPAASRTRTLRVVRASSSAGGSNVSGSSGASSSGNPSQPPVPDNRTPPTTSGGVSRRPLFVYSAGGGGGGEGGAGSGGGPRPVSTGGSGGRGRRPAAPHGWPWTRALLVLLGVSLAVPLWQFVNRRFLFKARSRLGELQAQACSRSALTAPSFPPTLTPRVARARAHACQGRGRRRAGQAHRRSQPR